MSTFYSERYARHKTMPIIQPYDSNGNLEEKKLVYINPKLLKRLRNIKSWKPHEWAYDDSIVSVCFRYYGTTTLYWVIVYYNGIVDQFEINPGTTLKIPDIQEVDQVFKDLSINPFVVGSTVSI